MFLYLHLVFAFPLSMLLILCGALGVGAIAAIWFAADRGRTTQHVIKVVIHPDTEPELVEKIR